MDETTTDATQDAAASTVEALGDAGKRALTSEREARKAAERKVTDLSAQGEALRAQFEQATKESQEALAKAQADFEAATAENVRLAAVIAKGVPASLAAYVHGSTSEEAEASAEQVLADFRATNGPRPPIPDPTLGATAPPAAPANPLAASLAAAVGARL